MLLRVAFKLSQGFEKSIEVGKDPDDDSENRAPGNPGSQEGCQAQPRVSLIEMIERERPTKSQQRDFDQCAFL